MPSLYASAQSSTVTDFLLTTPSMCHVPHHLCVLPRAIPATWTPASPFPSIYINPITLVFKTISNLQSLKMYDLVLKTCALSVWFICASMLGICEMNVLYFIRKLLFLTIVKQIGEFMLCWLFLRSPMSIPFLTCAFYPESDALGEKNHLLPMLCFLKFGILSFKSYSMLW